MFSDISSNQIGESCEVRAFTFKALTQVVKCAGEKKLKEVQLCLEGLWVLMYYNYASYLLLMHAL